MHWGVLAVERSSGRVLYRNQPARKFIPASNLKLLVGASALQQLGPEFRFETSLKAAGRFDRATGSLEGDLVLTASGDPTLSDRFWPSDSSPLEALVDSLRAAGLGEVSGALVVDASAWDSTSFVGSWMVEDISLPTAAPGGPFVLAEGVTTVVVHAAQEPGEMARVTWTPLGEDDFVASRVETAADSATDARIQAEYFPESRRIVLGGSIPAGTVDTLRLATRDPVRQATAALARRLTEAGIALGEGWRVSWSREVPLAEGCAGGALEACAAPTLAQLSSPPLLQIVEATLEASQNWMAEQVVRALGLHDVPREDASGTPRAEPVASWSTGLQAVTAFMVEEVGVDTLDLRLRDGSGLSTQNLVTPRALVALLDYAADAPWGGSFKQALAEPGEEGSTLAGRLEGLEGRAFAKTGTLTNVVGLSGYLERPDGEVVLFSILTNGSALPARTVESGVDRIVRILANGRT